MAKKMKSQSYLVCGHKMITIQMSANSENDLVCTNVSAKKGMTETQLLKDRKHFSQSTMVSAAVSKLGKYHSFEQTYTVYYGRNDPVFQSS